MCSQQNVHMDASQAISTKLYTYSSTWYTILQLSVAPSTTRSRIEALLSEDRENVTRSAQ